MKMKSLFMALAVLVVASGCTNTKIDQMSQADPYQKTIMIPDSVGKLTSDVRELLKQDNWQVGNKNQPISNARYTMTLTYDEVNVCAPRFDAMYDYDLGINDNRGGRVFSMHGRDCQHTILSHLDAFLQNKKQ